MADFVTDLKIGIDLTATYASTSAGSTILLPANPGDVVGTTRNGRYMFARADSTVSQYDCVIFNVVSDSASLTPIIRAMPITTTNAAAGGVGGPGAGVGFAQVAVTSAYYGWFCINGQPRVNLLIGCNPRVPLYTTATAGSLDDTTVSAGMIQGLQANTSATSASAPFCTANYPQIMVQGAG